jgi:uncharacterized protein
LAIKLGHELKIPLDVGRMTGLRIAPDLTLPLDAVTETVGILARKRAGKSYVARKLTEQLLTAGQQVVIVDPKGDHWGLRSSSDGKHAGFPILIIGGEHGDVPLESSVGEVLARFVVEERVSLLLDLAQFRKHEVATFMTVFLETLYRLKAREQFRTPMMLVIDEADAIGPQRPLKGEERMLGAAEDIVRRGGQRGIGCTLITQRAAVLNKNLLTQVQILIVLRTVGPQDLGALDEWIQLHGTREQRGILMDSLPSLPVGTAWVWSPGWPSGDGIFQRVQVAPIETFDSGATPKVGQKITPPKTLADVDLGSLKQLLAATIEKAKADDPRELRRRIAELERQLRQQHELAWLEVPVISQEQIDSLSTIANDTARAAAQIATAADQLLAASGRILEGLTLGNTVKPRPAAAVAPVQTTAQDNVVERTTKRSARSQVQSEPAIQVNETGEVNKSQRRLLNSMATFEHLGIDKPKRVAVAALAGYTMSGTVQGMFAQLNRDGFILFPSAGAVELTGKGRRNATPQLGIKYLEDLHDAWYALLNDVSRGILKVVIERYPSSVSRKEIAEQLGYAMSGTFQAAVSSLKKYQIVEFPDKGHVLASAVLFPALPRRT